MRTIATLGLLLVAGVAAAVTIADVVANPDSYDKQTVTLTGTVESAVPVLGEGAYDLRDGVAKITIVSRTAPPANGTTVSVTGTARVFHEGDGGPEENQFPPWVYETSRAPAP